MSKEGVKIALASIEEEREGIALTSGMHHSIASVFKVNRLLEAVVTALEQGATVNDFRPLTDKVREEAVIHKALKVYSQTRTSVEII